MKVLENLYVYLWNDPKENNCNSILIGGKTPMLIDPGHLRLVESLKQRIRADGFDPEKIKVVICTHAHPDHLEGTLAFGDSTVKIGMSKEEETFVQDVGRPMYKAQGLDIPDYRVDFFLQEGVLNVGKHELEVLLTPGHSPGSISLYWPRHKVLVTGDVVFMRGVGRTDFPGGDLETLKRSVARLAKLPVELLIPGHGPAIPGADAVKANFQFIGRAFSQTRA